MIPDIKYDYSTIYPGVFVPMMDEKEAIRELKRCHKEKDDLPPVNVLEFPEAYKIEVAVPGVTREDILINTEEDILSVKVVLKKKGDIEKDADFKMHEFNYGNFDRHILLPDKADTIFMAAEYRSGILHIIIPKSIYPAKNKWSRVVVY